MLFRNVGIAKSTYLRLTDGSITACQRVVSPRVHSSSRRSCVDVCVEYFSRRGLDHRSLCWRTSIQAHWETGPGPAVDAARELFQKSGVHTQKRPYHRPRSCGESVRFVHYNLLVRPEILNDVVQPTVIAGSNPLVKHRVGAVADASHITVASYKTRRSRAQC